MRGSDTLDSDAALYWSNRTGMLKFVKLREAEGVVELSGQPMRARSIGLVVVAVLVFCGTMAAVVGWNTVGSSRIIAIALFSLLGVVVSIALIVVAMLMSEFVRSRGPLLKIEADGAVEIGWHEPARFEASSIVGLRVVRGFVSWRTASGWHGTNHHQLQLLWRDAPEDEASTQRRVLMSGHRSAVRLMADAFEMRGFVVEWP